MAEYIANCNEIELIGGKTILVPDYIDTTKEIIRCINCKHRYSLTCECHVCALNEKFMPFVELDDFCSKGKRRDTDA